MRVLVVITALEAEAEPVAAVLVVITAMQATQQQMRVLVAVVVQELSILTPSRAEMEAGEE